MTLKEFAERLNNSTEISHEDVEKAKKSGFVIVSGYKYFRMVFKVSIYGYGDCNRGGVVRFTKNTVFKNYEDCKKAIHVFENNGNLIEDIEKSINEIEAIWCPTGIKDSEGNDINSICWAYKTIIPHETFFIKEDGEIYCRGIVFKISDLK